MKYIVRKETKADYKKTEHMVMRSFWNIHGPGCNEHLLVRIIRESPDYLPEISRVVETDGKIVGAIFYTKAKVVDGEQIHDIITFGPLAVEPTLQNEGIGKLLLEETFSLAKEAGYSGICIYGEPDYYPKRGFRTCDNYKITTPDGSNFDALMGLALNEEKFTNVHGKLYESDTFEGCEDETAIRKINEEFPNYPMVKVKEGFLQIYGGRFGKVVAVKDDEYTVAYWELKIHAKLNLNMASKLDKSIEIKAGKPVIGDIVIFDWKRDGLSEITAVCENIL